MLLRTMIVEYYEYALVGSGAPQIVVSINSKFVSRLCEKGFILILCQSHYNMLQTCVRSTLVVIKNN